MTFSSTSAHGFTRGRTRERFRRRYATGRGAAGWCVGLGGLSSGHGSVDRYEGGSLQPDMLATSAINAHSELIPVARAGGVSPNDTLLTPRLV